MGPFPSISQKYMEEKLKVIINRIEQSPLSTGEKAELYTVISSGLQASIWPILIQYVPKEKFDDLSKKPNDKDTALEFAKLIGESVEDGKALTEMDDVMNRLLDEVESALREEHI